MARRGTTTEKSLPEARTLEHLEAFSNEEIAAIDNGQPYRVVLQIGPDFKWGKVKGSKKWEAITGSERTTGSGAKVQRMVDKKPIYKVIEIDAIWGAQLGGLMTLHNKFLDHNEMKDGQVGQTRNLVQVLHYNTTTQLPPDDDSVSPQIRFMSQAISAGIEKAVEKFMTNQTAK